MAHISVVPVAHGVTHAAVGESLVFTANEECTLYFHNDKIFGVNKARLTKGKDGYSVTLTVQDTAEEEHTTLRAFKGALDAKAKGEPTDIIVP